mmetsp:Transcript_66361/g.191557  ORF Transcript_66361/g.191557 Transcript_66361/m.191557 type:complete len:212 (+) Transcript_66361:110-745(+)
MAAHEIETRPNDAPCAPVTPHDGLQCGHGASSADSTAPPSSPTSSDSFSAEGVSTAPSISSTTFSKPDSSSSHVTSLADHLLRDRFLRLRGEGLRNRAISLLRFHLFRVQWSAWAFILRFRLLRAKLGARALVFRFHLVRFRLGAKVHVFSFRACAQRAELLSPSEQLVERLPHTLARLQVEHTSDPIPNAMHLDDRPHVLRNCLQELLPR